MEPRGLRRFGRSGRPQYSGLRRPNSGSFEVAERDARDRGGERGRQELRAIPEGGEFGGELAAGPSQRFPSRPAAFSGAEAQTLYLQIFALPWSAL